MTLLEYLQSLAPKGRVFHRKHGMFYIDTAELYGSWLSPGLSLEQRMEARNRKLGDRQDTLVDALEIVTDVERGCGDAYYPSEEEMARLSGIELRLDGGTEEYDTYVRRPYYRMRGRRVTPEQAQDIIRRTDEMITDLGVYCGAAELPARKRIDGGDHIGTVNFNQWWFMRNHSPTHYGWSHPDGRIGCNAITQRYPNYREYLTELLRWKVAFPYLDLTIAVSCWNEEPPYRWDARQEIIQRWNGKLSAADTQKMREELSQTDYMEFPDFCENLEIGICTHDNVIEFMNPKNAAERYREYETRYGAEDPKVYVPEYYEDRKLLICDNAYLIRCLRGYGMTEAEAWELLETEPKYTWGDEAFFDPY